MADRYVVMGQCFIVDGSATVAEAGRLIADDTLNVTDPGGTGTFDIYVASGTTCVITDGTSACDVSGDTLNPGKTTVTITGSGTLDFDITIGVAANTNDVNSWSAASGGACTASVPTSIDNFIVDANSFTAGSQVLTANATANFLDMDWTGVTNNPTFTGALAWNCYGSITLAAGITWSKTGILTGYGNGTHNFAGLTMAYVYVSCGANTFTLASNLTFKGGGYTFAHISGTLDLANFTINTSGGNFTENYAAARTLTMGAGTITSATWQYDTGSNLTITANTGTINLTSTFSGGGLDFNGADINLNGTSHTISGSFTCAILTRNGTATKTDSVTFTSGITITCTTFAMIGNSATNRLLVQSSTLGTPATITATNWTGTNACDIMDITATNAVDLSAAAAYTGDCGGNTNITFTTAAAQISDADGNWSTVATWQDGVGTDRVPLPQDDVSCSHNVTVDMPRIGADITFTGTPTVSGFGAYARIYGSLDLTGVTLVGLISVIFAGRGAHTLKTDAVTMGAVVTYNVGGTVTLASNYVGNDSLSLRIGTFNDGGYNVTVPKFYKDGTYGNVSVVKSGDWILNSAVVTTNKFSASGMVSFTDNAGTITMTNSTANAQSFVGGGFTYNNVTIEGAGNYALTISGNNTFNTLTVDRSAAAKMLKLTTGSTQTVADFVCTQSGVTVLTITSSDGVNPATLAKSGGGTINLTYLALSYNTGSPADTWHCDENSTRGASVTGWSMTFIRTYTALLGLLSTATRVIEVIRLDTTLLGLTTTAARVLALTRIDTALLGLKTTATRIVTLVRISTALLGLKTTGVRAVALTRTDTALLGLKTTGTRVVTLIRGFTGLLGLKTTATRAVAYVRLNTALLGLLTTGTRVLALIRADTVLLGLLTTGNKHKVVQRITGPASRAYNLGKSMVRYTLGRMK